MKKKVICFWIVFSFLLSLCGCFGNYSVDGMKFSSGRGGMLTLTSYSGSESEVVIPSDVKGKSVGSIADGAFYGKSVTSVTLPETVKSIGKSAFRDCGMLENVTLGTSLETVGEYAFYGCSVLKSVVLPQSTKTIGKSAFECCGSMTELVIDGAETIEETAFCGCEKLTSVTIPESASKLGKRAFYNCPALKLVTISSKSTVIGENALGYITSRTDGENTQVKNFIMCGINSARAEVYADSHGFPFMEAVYASDLSYELTDSGVRITGYKGILENIIIPDKLDGHNVVAIGESAFSDKQLKKILMPDTITSIGAAAFYHCTSLEMIDIPEGVTDIGGGAFAETKWFSGKTDEFVIVGDGILIRYNGNDESVTVPSEVKKVSGAFSGNAYIKKVTLNDTLGEIGDWSFLTCTSLTDVIIPSSVTKIGDSAFAWCPSITEFTVGEGVTEIGDKAFFGCSSLESVHISASVKSIGSETFATCEALSEIEIPSTVTQIGSDAFDKQHISKIISAEGSAAHTYAKENKIRFSRI